MPGCDHGLVSVLMSVYNGAPTLEKAAASVLAQTYRDLELILCDDASTDDTWRIMQRIAAQDARVTVFQNKTNRGLGASLNGCLSRAGGEYIARQDADDVSDPDRIERTTDFLLSSGAPYAACGVRVFDDGGKYGFEIIEPKMTAPEVEIKRLSTVGNHLSATVTARELRGRDAQIELDFTDTSVSGSAKVPLIGTVTIKEGTKIAE